MVFKIAGSIIVIVSSVCIGRFYAQKLRFRLEALKELKRLMVIMKNDISYLATPLPEIMGQSRFADNSIFGKFFTHISEELKKGGVAFSDVWERCVESDLDETELTSVDKEEFKKVGGNFRATDRQMQINQYEHFIVHLDSEIEELSGEVAQKSRIYNLLGFSGGAFIVLICF